jgi:spermidine synthase
MKIINEQKICTSGADIKFTRRQYLTVLFLLAFSFMVYQVAVLRELRFQLNTLFTITPFLFSAVVILIGAGSLSARFFRNTLKILKIVVLLMPLIAMPLFMNSILITQQVVDHTSTSSFFGAPLVGGSPQYMTSVICAFIIAAIFGYGIVFFLQGLMFALYFRQGRDDGTLSNVYGVDLFASGLGALAGGALSFILTPVQLAMAASGVLIINLLFSFRFLNIKPVLALLEVIMVLIMIFSELIFGGLASLESPYWLGSNISYSRWTPYRRIDAAEDKDTFMVYADGILFQMYLKGENPHHWDIRKLPLQFLKNNNNAPQKVLIIGSGTGSDIRILRDLGAANLEITAVEIDPGFVETAGHFPWLWDSYRTAKIIVREGRYYLENTDEKFDMVIYGYVDPQSAVSTIGLPDANFLYTDSGLQSAYSHLEQGGILLITRIFFVEQEKEFLKRTCATVVSAGIPAEYARFYRDDFEELWGYYGRISTAHVVIGKGLKPAEITTGGVRPMECTYGGQPTTDFYPLSIESRIWFISFIKYFTDNPAAGIFLGILLIILILRLSTGRVYLNFFILGFGSFLLESMVLFHSFLLIGNPSLSTSIAVGVFLIWNSVGSRYSAFFEKYKIFFVLVPVAMLVYSATAPMLNVLTIGSSEIIRIIAFALHLSFAGIVAGAIFPVSLRKFNKNDVPGMFFIDLIGCALAPAGFWLLLGLHGLFPVAFACCLCYGIVAVIIAVK